MSSKWKNRHTNEKRNIICKVNQEKNEPGCINKRQKDDKYKKEGKKEWQWNERLTYV